MKILSRSASRVAHNNQMSEQTKATSPADEITKSSEENTVELTETDLSQVTGGAAADFKTTGSKVIGVFRLRLRFRRSIRQDVHS